MNSEYSIVFWSVWLELNWLKTVISTMPITIQIAIFLKRLFKACLAHPNRALDKTASAYSRAECLCLQTMYSIAQPFSRAVSAPFIGLLASACQKKGFGAAIP